jgi:ABC-type nickel/cobalt efflux system permease component RcnA
MRISPFARGLAIIALVSLAIVVLNLETSLATASVLLRVAFFLAVAFAAYMFWRDFGRREISIWPALSQWVFYGAVALLVIDLGWYFVTPLGGLDALAFFLVAGACVYAAVRTWRRQRRYGG